MHLVTLSPVAHGRSGLPKDEAGRPYLPAEDLKEALLAAAFVYATRKDAGFKARVKKAVIEEKTDLKRLARRLEAALLERDPFLADLDLPPRLYLEDGAVRERRTLLVNLNKGDVVRDEMVEVMEGIIPLPWDLPEKEKRHLAAAGRSLAEALATMELEKIRDPLPELVPFYEELKSQKLKKLDWPLRLGYWGEDPFHARLIAFRRVPEVRKALDALGYRIEPKRLLFLPKEKKTLGWVYLTDAL